MRKVQSRMVRGKVVEECTLSSNTLELLALVVTAYTAVSVGRGEASV